MADRLSQYIKDSLKKGKSQAQIKQELIEVGWDDKMVDKSLKNASKTSFVTKAITLIFVISILFFGGNLLTNFMEFATQETPVENQPIAENSETIPESTLSTCQSIDSTQKQNCYEETLNDASQCRQLENQEEITYCYRALEEMTLDI